MFATLWQLLFSIFPAWFAVGLLSFITIVVIILIIKVISLVLSAIPFL